MNEVVHTSPTIGSNVEEVVFRNIHFIVWDLGGQQSLRAAWSTYYTNTESHGASQLNSLLLGSSLSLCNPTNSTFQFIIMVIDSTDRERLAVTREELYRMLQHEDLAKASLLVYANKQDLKGSMSAAEISRQLDLTSIKKHQWHIQACCALTGEGLYQGLEWIGQRIKKK
uniref:small monomeric GTPase n=1 Tax=Phlebotomus papatasi TaxID=29031 RepID=A0A1B0CZI7_PHLPP